MERYSIFPHTADAKFQAYGRTLEEAFANAALALASLMWDWSAVESTVTIPVRVRARDREQLLVKFLGEIVYLLDARSFLLARVDDLRIIDGGDGLILEAGLAGDEFSDRYEILGHVKGVTYHEMKIEESAGAVMVQVVVDV